MHRFPTVRTDRYTGLASVHRAFRTECTKRGFMTHYGPLGKQVIPLSCGGCDHCLWVKRQSIASAVALELAASDWAVYCTFTIAPGIERASDRLDTEIQSWPLQNFHKVCRSHIQRKTHSFSGRDVRSWRYVQCGEYGKRGTKRAHYHLVIFGKGERPVWADRAARNVHIPEWPHGLVDIQTNVTAGVAFYISKYMSKDKESWHSRSSGYAIGAEMAKARAAQLAVGLGHSPLPTQDNKLTYLAKGKNRRGLMRNAMRRDYNLAFAEAQGKSLLAYAPMMRAESRVSLVGPVLWQRRREFKEKHGREPRFFEDERLKLGVYNELRAYCGLPPLRHLNDLPHKPLREVVADRPKKPVATSQAGRDRIKRTPLDGWARGDRVSVLADLEAAHVAAVREASSAPACGCPSCKAAFAPDQFRAVKPRRRLHMGEVALARQAYEANPLPCTVLQTVD